MLNFISTAPDEQAARDRAAFPVSSVSVEVVVRGWKPGDGPLDSHGLCLLLRDGGLRLGEALDRTKDVLDGRDIAARLPFPDSQAARDALVQLGATASR